MCTFVWHRPAPWKFAFLHYAAETKWKCNITKLARLKTESYYLKMCSFCIIQVRNWSEKSEIMNLTLYRTVTFLNFNLAMVHGYQNVSTTPWACLNRAVVTNRFGPPSGVTGNWASSISTMKSTNSVQFWRTQPPNNVWILTILFPVIYTLVKISSYYSSFAFFNHLNLHWICFPQPYKCFVTAAH